MTTIPKLKFCAVILSYGKVPFLKKTIESVSPLKTFILNPTKSWLDERMVDNTEKISSGYNVEIIKGDWKEQHEARNHAKEIAKNYDYTFILDSDEVISNLKEIMNFVSKTRGSAYCMELVEFLKDGSTLPETKHTPIVMINPNAPFTFYTTRCWNGGITEIPKSISKLAHYGFCVDEDEIQYKKDNYHKFNERYGDRL